MSLSLSFPRKAVIGFSLACWLLPSPSLHAGYVKQGGEFAVCGALPSDQVHPRIALSPSGGYIVWEDTYSDAEGLGISCMRLDSGFSGVLSPLRVNSIPVDDQERPGVSLLKDGGAVFVWQGGKLGFQHVYARVLSSESKWIGPDVRVSKGGGIHETYPCVATLANGNIVVIYSSFNQYSASSMHDIYGQLLSPAGEKIGGEFLVNQFTSYNQRTPVVAALASGGFVVAWVSEQQRTAPKDSPDPNHIYGTYEAPSVDIYARRFDADARPSGAEFLVSTSGRICANPAITANGSGYAIVWGEKEAVAILESWDVYARIYSASGAASDVKRVNTTTIRDQYDPQIAVAGSQYLVVWNSVAQDGSQDGVYGQYINSDGTPSGDEFRVNTSTISKQVHPAVCSEGTGRAVVAWTSYVGSGRGFDLFAQRYSEAAQPALVPISQVFVHAPFTLENGVYKPELQVSWPAQGGLEVDHYEVFINGATSAATSTTDTVWRMSSAEGLKPSTEVSFQVGFVTRSGQKAPLSNLVKGKTWSGYSWGGVPFEWMNAKFGTDLSVWPGAGSELAPNGPTLLQTFMSGGNPTDPSSWLRTKLEQRSNGVVLQWNPQPGFLYQVQTSSDLTHWENIGGARLAVGTADELNVGLGNGGYYRLMLLR